MADLEYADRFLQSPAKFDILCGKDKTYGRHPGNRYFRLRIEASVDYYTHASNKQEKMQFTRDIVRFMQSEYGSRFLRPVTVDGRKLWEEISEATARDKVSHALRFAAASRLDTCKPEGEESLNDCKDENKITKEAIRAYRASKPSSLREADAFGKLSARNMVSHMEGNESKQPINNSTAACGHESHRPHEVVSASLQRPPFPIYPQDRIPVSTQDEVRSLAAHRQLLLNGVVHTEQSLATAGMLRLHNARLADPFHYLLASQNMPQPITSENHQAQHIHPSTLPLPITGTHASFMQRHTVLSAIPAYSSVARISSAHIPAEAYMMVHGRQLPCLVLLSPQDLTR